MRWRVPPCTSVLRPRRRLQQERHLLNAQHARQPARLAHNREPAGKIRPVERHAEEEAQGRNRAVDARRLHAALRLVQLEAAQILSRRGVGRAADEGCKRPHVPNVVVARLLAEAAHAHVLDHARTQRADGPVRRMRDDRGLLSRAEGCWTFDARDRMPRSSRRSVHAITAAADAPTTTRTPPARVGSFYGFKERTYGRDQPYLQ